MEDDRDVSCGVLGCGRGGDGKRESYCLLLGSNERSEERGCNRASKGKGVRKEGMQSRVSISQSDAHV